jgi:hypothetical protein
MRPLGPPPEPVIIPEFDEPSVQGWGDSPPLLSPKLIGRSRPLADGWWDGKPAWWLLIGFIVGALGTSAFWLDLAWRLRP